MRIQEGLVALSLMVFVQNTLAGVDLGTPVGTTVGSALSVEVGSSLPIGLGGIAAIAAIGLVLGVQMIRRRKK